MRSKQLRKAIYDADDRIKDSLPQKNEDDDLVHELDYTKELLDKDAGLFVCPAGHMAVRKARQGKKDGKWNQTWTFFFDTDKCKTCSRKEGCYKDGAKSKTYSVSIKTGEQECFIRMIGQDVGQRL